jgi:hypothetical protein
VRVLGALGRAMAHPPTLSTAAPINIAMMARAQADLLALLRAR